MSIFVPLLLVAVLLGIIGALFVFSDAVEVGLAFLCGAAIIAWSVVLFAPQENTETRECQTVGNVETCTVTVQQ